MTVDARLSDSGSRWPVLGGRALAATAIALAVYGVVTLVAIGRFDHFADGAAMFGLFTIGFGALALLAFSRQPFNRAVWIPAWSAFFTGISTAGWATAVLLAEADGIDASPLGFSIIAPADLPTDVAISYSVIVIGASLGFFPMLTHWLLRFPGGEYQSPRWRWVGRTATITMIALATVLLWVARPSSTIPFRSVEGRASYPLVGPFIDPLYLALVVISAICAVSLFLRYRHSKGEARLQYRWVGLGTVALFFSVAVVDEPAWQLTAALLGVTVAVVCYGVAVAKYRLYGIDIVISRTVVYGTLAGFIGAVYVVVVVVVGGVIGSGARDLALPILATALVAVAFEPMRRLAQKWANQLVYGKRTTPYEVLSDLTSRLARTESAEDVLTRMARLMAESTGAQQATVWLAEEERLTAAAGWPETSGKAVPHSLEALTGTVSQVRHDEQLVGALQVITSRGNPTTPSERRLLDDLAGSAGMVLGNQRLNAALEARASDLLASRRRLVQVQDEERRRLERNLHDGAQQQVVALKVQMSLAAQIASKHGAVRLADRITHVAGEIQGVLDEIRTMARGIYPPLLESDGLEAALRSFVTMTRVPVKSTIEGVGRYSKEIETAVYFAATEAIVAAARHRDPANIEISLEASGPGLRLQVTDDGSQAGREGRPSSESWLVSVRDRIETLGGVLAIRPSPGGGTIVTVELPFDNGEGSTEPLDVTSPQATVVEVGVG